MKTFVECKIYKYKYCGIVYDLILLKLSNGKLLFYHICILFKSFNIEFNSRFVTKRFYFWKRLAKVLIFISNHKRYDIQSRIVYNYVCFSTLSNIGMESAELQCVREKLEE